MKRDDLLTIASLLSILLFTLHLTGDIVRGVEKGGISNLTAVPIFTVWLYGTSVLAGRRSGHVIMLLGALLGLAAPILHMSGNGVGGAVAASDGAFFYIWTIIAIGVSSLFAFVLAVRELWNPSAG